jgi:WD40 repeat protein
MQLVSLCLALVVALAVVGDARSGSAALRSGDGQQDADEQRGLAALAVTEAPTGEYEYYSGVEDKHKGGKGGKRRKGAKETAPPNTTPKPAPGHAPASTGMQWKVETLTPFLGGSVTSVDIKGDRVLAGLTDKTVRVRSLSSKEEKVLSGHAASVVFVALVAGDKAVSAGRDGTVLSWDLDSGNKVAEMGGADKKKPKPGPSGGSAAGGLVTALAADGKSALVGESDGSAAIYDHCSGTQTATLSGHTAAVTAAALTTDTAITGSKDNTIRVWNRATGELLKTITVHSGDVRSLAVWGDMIVSGGADAFRGYDLAAGKQLFVSSESGGPWMVALRGSASVSVWPRDSKTVWYTAVPDVQSRNWVELPGRDDCDITALAFERNTVVTASCNQVVIRSAPSSADVGAAGDAPTAETGTCGGLSTGAIVGIVIACLVAVALVIVAVVIVKKKKAAGGSAPAAAPKAAKEKGPSLMDKIKAKIPKKKEPKASVAVSNPADA